MACSALSKSKRDKDSQKLKCKFEQQLFFVKLLSKLNKIVIKTEPQDTTITQNNKLTNKQQIFFKLTHFTIEANENSTNKKN